MPILQPPPARAASASAVSVPARPLGNESSGEVRRLLALPSAKARGLMQQKAAGSGAPAPRALPSKSWWDPVRSVRAGASCWVTVTHKHPAQRRSAVSSSPAVAGAKERCQHPVCPGSCSSTCGRLGLCRFFPLKVFSFPSGELSRGKVVPDTTQSPRRAVPVPLAEKVGAQLTSDAHPHVPAAQGIPKNGIPAAQKETCFQTKLTLSSNSCIR